MTNKIKVLIASSDHLKNPFVCTLADGIEKHGVDVT